MSILQVLTDYLSIGFRLLPILHGTKSPNYKNWNAPGNSVSSPDQLQDVPVENYNWGLHHVDSGTCAIDIDDYDEAHDELSQHGINLDELLSRDVQIDSGNPGHAKLLYRLPPWVDPLPTVQIRTGKTMAIEFRCAAKDGIRSVQDLLPPSKHPSGSDYQWRCGDPDGVQMLPDELLQVWERYLEQRTQPQQKGPAQEKDVTLSDATAPGRISEALSFVDPDADRDAWLNVGMAVHNAMGMAGFDVWAEWSRKGSKYAGEDDLQNVWASIDEDPTGITYRTLYMYAKRNGWKPTPTWAELQQAVEKEAPEEDSEATDKAPGKPLVAVLLQAVEDLADRSIADPETVVLVQQILLEAEQLSNPAMQLPVHHRIKGVFGWTDKVLETHLKYLRAKTRALLADGSGGPKFVHKHSSGLPTDHTANLQAICDHHDISIRHNLMTHDLEIRDPEVANWLVDDKTNLQYIHIRNLVIQYGMPYSRADEHISAIGSLNAYHPMEEYLKQTKWDGRDWFALVANTVQTTDKKLWELTLGKWALSACAAVRGKAVNMPPRGVLVMTGEQWSGKTTWFRYLTPSRDMFGEGVQLNPSSKDSVKIATNKVIVELGELDHTFSRADIGKLKAFISTPYDEMRLPYARTESKWPRRTVYCGTVNDPGFLRDPTGNTRFWVNEIQSIDLNTMQELHQGDGLAQFWAQVNHWLDCGERWDMTRSQMDAIENKNMQYLDRTLPDELLMDYFAWPENDQFRQIHSHSASAVNPMTITEIATFIGFDISRNSGALRELRASLRRLTRETGHNRTTGYKWDPTTETRATKGLRARWYFMPYPQEHVRIGRTLSSGLTVVQGQKSPVVVQESQPQRARK